MHATSAGVAGVAPGRAVDHAVFCYPGALAWCTPLGGGRHEFIQNNVVCSGPNLLLLPGNRHHPAMPVKIVGGGSPMPWTLDDDRTYLDGSKTHRRIAAECAGEALLGHHSRRHRYPGGLAEYQHDTALSSDRAPSKPTPTARWTSTSPRSCPWVRKRTGFPPWPAKVGFPSSASTARASRCFDKTWKLPDIEKGK